MTSPAQTTTIKILYNDCYGGFGFSEEFAAAYKERTGREVNTFSQLFRAVRADPVAVELFERLGAKRASGEYASLAVREIPALFERYWTIEEYDGNESVHVNVNEAYADLLHQYMDSGDSAALCDGYRVVKATAERLFKSSGIGLGEDEVVIAPAATPSILKRPSIVDEEDDYSRTVGYSYFGIGDGPGAGASAGAGHA